MVGLVSPQELFSTLCFFGTSTTSAKWEKQEEEEEASKGSCRNPF